MEATVQSTRTVGENPYRTAAPTQVDLKLEVVVLPVADVDRARQFYEGLGWRLDGDFASGDWRVVQLTPPGSPCSIMFGKGFTNAAPGSVHGSMLIVGDVAVAREDLVARGAAVSEVFHFDGGRLIAGAGGRVPGRDPEERSYFSFASFSDPDGNSWLLQEVTARLPGRGFSNLDVVTLTGLLMEAEAGHGKYESTAPKHRWADWYAPYVIARQRGKSATQASDEAARHTDDVLRRAAVTTE